MLKTLSSIRRLTWQQWWLAAAILSFAHELPLVRVFGLNRLEPRVFDVVALGAILVLLSARKAIKTDPLFNQWLMILAVFFLATLLSVYYFPLRYSYFSVFYLLKYLEGAVVILAALQVKPRSDALKIVAWCLCLGGVYVALYCIPQYLSGGAKYTLSSGVQMSFVSGGLLGPLGTTYFHIASFSSLASVVTFGLAVSQKRQRMRVILLLVSAFIAWPLFFSGSRTGVALLVGSFGILGLISASSRRAMILMIFFGSVLFAAGVGNDGLKNLEEQSLTFQRWEQSESKQGHFNSISERIKVKYDPDNYVLGFGSLVLGAGFYIAPTGESLTNARYRVGYGVHNGWLFPLEQGGVMAFILFLMFYYKFFVRISRRPTVNHTITNIRKALTAYAATAFIVLIVGQVFWMGFGTENFNTLIVMLMVLFSAPIGLPKPLDLK